MPTNILMPALSPTMEEGTLAKWLKAEGDTVSAGDIIAEIETDKATMEFEAVEEGMLGKSLIDQRRYREALLPLGRALELRQDYPEAHCNAGIVLMELGDLGRAEGALRRSLALADRPETRQSLGVVLLRQGKHAAEADLAIRRADARVRALQTSKEIRHDLQNTDRTNLERRADRWMRD